jgi:methylthioribose-1-phosphate isomerase
MSVKLTKMLSSAIKTMKVRGAPAIGVAAAFASCAMADISGEDMD